MQQRLKLMRQHLTELISTPAVDRTASGPHQIVIFPTTDTNHLILFIPIYKLQNLGSLLFILHVISLMA